MCERERQRVEREEREIVRDRQELKSANRQRQRDTEAETALHEDRKLKANSVRVWNTRRAHAEQG